MTLQTSKKWLSNLLQGGFLIILLVAASYVTMGRILVANVDRYRSDLEGLLTTAIGTEVQIKQLQGDWAYLNPSLKIEQLAIGQDKAILVEHVDVAIDTVASLRERTPIVRSLAVDGVRFVLERTTAGWKIKGLPVSDRKFNADPLLKSLDYMTGVVATDVQLQAVAEEKVLLVSSDPEQPAEILRIGEALNFVLPLQLSAGDAAGKFLFAGRTLGALDSIEREGDFYLSLPNVDIAEFLPATVRQRYPLQQMRVAGDVWLSYAGDAFEVQGQTRVSARFPSSDSDLNTQQVFASSGDFNGEIVGAITEFTGEFADRIWHLNDIGVSFEPGPSGDRLAIQIPVIEIAGPIEMLAGLGKAGIGLNQAQVETLAALKPTGSVNALMGVVTFGDELDYRVIGSLDSVSVDRYKALPVISDLNGLIQAGPRNGFLDMVNTEPFSLQFPGMFEEQWLFDSARARVTYEVTSAGIQAKSDLVEALWGDLVANGRFHIRLPGDPLQTTWGLELGVQYAELTDAFRFLPKTLKQEVKDWLVSSVLGGFSKESGMVFHGSLAKEAAKDQKAHQLYFKVSETTLDYDPAWPPMDDLAATIFVDNFEISSDDAIGRVYDTRIYGATVMVPVSAQGVADSILIEGKLSGAFSDGVRLLTESPLRDATSNMADGWIAQGSMLGSAKLNVPIGGRAERGESTWADVEIELDGAELEMPGFDLHFLAIKGGFGYESNTAMRSSGFEANLFGQPVTGLMKSTGDIAGGEIVVHMDGNIESRDLHEWSDQPLLSRAHGLMGYESELHVFYGDRAQEPIFVEATSNLRGVELHFPQPMGKSAGEEVELSYKQIFVDDSYRIEMDLGEEIQARLKVLDGTLIGGRLHFGHEPLGVVSFDQLKVTGELAHVIYEDWDRLTVELQGVSTSSFEEELQESLDVVEVTIGLFDVFGFEMDNVFTVIHRDNGYWRVNLENEWLEGQVSVSDDPVAPLEIAMQRLVFESNTLDPSADPLGQVFPSDLIAAQFSVEEFILDDEDYGSWAFLYEPGVDRALLSGLEVTVKGMQVSEDASVEWIFENGGHRSKFTGEVVVPDLGFTLQEWGYASSIEGQDFSFYGDVSWPGTPAMVGLEVIDGLIRINQGEGRFVQADSNMGALRLLGIFDFASLARRFRFDFSDVVQTGFSFSKIEGETRFSSGVVDVVDPILIVGSGSTFKVAGRVDLESRELDNDMIMTLPVNRNLPWYAAYSAFATGPLTGVGVFLAQKVFQTQIDTISSAKYKITGTMDEPVIEFVSFFSDSVRDVPGNAEPTPAQSEKVENEDSQRQAPKQDAVKGQE